MATTAHGLEYPTDYTDKADVPDVLADLVTSIEVALTAQDTERTTLITQVQSAGPIGMITAYAGNTAPTGWHLCDGTAHGSSALQAILGSANAPDLRDRFIVGAGSSYVRGNTGGAASVTLTAAQSGLPAHAHTASSGSDSANHTHTFSGTTSNTGTHTHGGGYVGNYMLQGDNPPNEGVWMVTQTAETLYTVNSAAGAHTHTYSGTTSGRSAYHSHTVTVNSVSAANASSAHENRPPYYALVYIVKKV